MPRSQSTGAVAKKFTLPNGVWNWRVLADGEVYRKLHYTEEGMTKKGDEKIQLVVKVGNREQNILVTEHVVFTDSAEWKRNEFLKSAGIYPGEKEYFLSAGMCIDLGGLCRTQNKTNDAGYENTNIVEFLEAGQQKPESIPGFLMSDNAEDAAIQAQMPQDAKPDYSDDIPFK